MVLRHDLRSVGSLTDRFQRCNVSVSLQLVDYRWPVRIKCPQVLAALHLLHVLDQVASTFTLQGLRVLRLVLVDVDFLRARLLHLSAWLVGQS